MGLTGALKGSCVISTPVGYEIEHHDLRRPARRRGRARGPVSPADAQCTTRIAILLAAARDRV